MQAVHFVKPTREEEEEEEWEKKVREEESTREDARERPKEAHARDVEDLDARFEALLRKGMG